MGSPFYGLKARESVFYDANVRTLFDKILWEGKIFVFFKIFDMRSFSFGEKCFGVISDLTSSWKSFNVDKLRAEISFLYEIDVFVGMWKMFLFFWSL